jgi:glycosyltransferase involved in cell wall biosynthesis
MHSVIVTIHNGARRIPSGEILLEKVLDGIINNTVGEYEVLCMLDGCTDDSDKVVDKYLDKANVRPIILPDIFELRTNNAAFKESKGEYVIVVQDDQVISEHGWNQRMQKPFDAFDDVFAVTARCAHNWVINTNSYYLNNPSAPIHGWCDIFEHVDHASDAHELSRDIFAVRSSCNRGPLMINLEDLERVGYLDEAFAPCDMDDHDLMYRAYIELGKVCGAYRIDMESNVSWSGARVGGDLPMWAYESQHKNSRIFYQRYAHILDARRVIDNRILN